MLDERFVILAAVLAMSGTVVYLRDTLRGVTHPNRMTWLLWGVAPLIAFAAEVNAGVGLRSLLAFSVGLGPLLVFGASFWVSGARWRITRADWLCGGLSLAGLVLWAATRQGNLAIAGSIISEVLAAVPTMRKSFRAPETESGGAYLAGVASAVVTLLTVSGFTVAQVAFPLCIFAVSAVQAGLVLGRPGPRWARRSQPARLATADADAG